MSELIIESTNEELADNEILNHDLLKVESLYGWVGLETFVCKKWPTYGANQILERVHQHLSDDTTPTLTESHQRFAQYR